MYRRVKQTILPLEQAISVINLFSQGSKAQAKVSLSNTPLIRTLTNAGVPQ